MVIGEEMGTDTLVPDALVRPIALIVTAHSKTPSAGESPMFTRTLVDWGCVGGVPLMGLEPLLHPTAPVMARVSASIVFPTQVAVQEDFIVTGCSLMFSVGRRFRFGVLAEARTMSVEGEGPYS
jgi:hypothetical protein